MTTADAKQEAEELVVRYLRERRSIPVMTDGTATDVKWAVLECEHQPDASKPWQDIACVGTIPGGAFHVGQFYRLFGTPSEYKNPHNGKSSPQFKFTSFCEEMPVDREGMIALLTRCGQIAGVGIGKRRCQALVDVYGDRVFDVICDTPALALETLARKKMVHTEEQFATFGRAVESHRFLAKEKAGVLGILANRGFPMPSIEAFVKKHELQSVARLRKNPHLLLQIPGFGISRVDQLYLDLGGDPKKPKRVALATKKMLADDNSGSVWHWRPAVEQAIAESIPQAKIDRSLRIAKRARLIDEVETDGPNGMIKAGGSTIWMADHEEAEIEERIVLVASGKAGMGFPRAAFGGFKECSPHQNGQVDKIAKSEIGILCGGPGTGKTFVLAKIAVLLASLNVRVIVGSPTGMARKRVEDAIVAEWLRSCAGRSASSGRDTNITCGTWHSFGAGGGYSSYLGHVDPHEGDMVIGDESSMCDQSQMAAILGRFGECQILLCGDPDQLPPVGSGSPFVDMINSGVIPVGRLTEVKRNKGGAVIACHDIRNGRPWSFGENFLHLPASNETEIAEGVLGQVAAARLQGLDPISEVQVVCAVNEGHAAAKHELNRRLQGMLNSEGEPVPKTDFRIGDKVLNRKNGVFDTPEGRQHRSNNGDCGVLEKVEHGGTKAWVKLQDGKIILVPIDAFVRTTAKRKIVVPGEEEIDNRKMKFDLGYAISVHAAQGSEWPRVIVVLDGSGKASRICGREWFTTAITRHKDLCVCVGDEKTARTMATRSCVKKRKTFLVEKLRMARAEMQMGDI